MFSSISTTSATSELFSAYISVIEGCIKQRRGVETTGLDGDELKELANDLWTMHDNFTEGEDETTKEEELDTRGEDEE